MKRQLLVPFELPGDLNLLRFPRGVDRRLQKLLDKQDEGTPLTAAERREAEGLVELAQVISLLRLRLQVAERDASQLESRASPERAKASRPARIKARNNEK